MGNSLLLQLEDTGRPQPFAPPPWAYVFDRESTLPSRVGSGFGQNFWWLELGGLRNTIADAEAIRDELLKTAWGVWDYMKNRGPQAKKLRNWRLAWLGALPGKRESRRYRGPHLMTQNDIESGGRFDDIVAYGGWSMDDHHPAGLYYPGNATLFHAAPSPYGIPFRALYSRNVPNLLCAGRNISATHVAMSSTRVMATCALAGQAVGTAAALCLRAGRLPGDIRGDRLRELQNQLMDDDVWLPGVVRRIAAPTREADLAVSNGADAEVLRSGEDRSRGEKPAYWSGRPGDTITLRWPAPRRVTRLRLVFDSDLDDHKRMPASYPAEGNQLRPAGFLVRGFTVEIRRRHTGPWETLHGAESNTRRLVVLPVDREVTAIRWRGDAAWRGRALRVFSMEAREDDLPIPADPPRGLRWTEITARLPAEDLAPPDNGLENVSRGSNTHQE